jgi:predicted secreted protein
MKKAVAVLIGMVMLFGTACAGTTVLYLVTLKENPTTGYEWFCEVSDETLLSVTDHGYTPNAVTDAALGEEGNHSWMIGGLQEGEVTVTFTYMRPWEVQPTDFIYSFTFEIDAGLNLSLLSSEKLPEEYTPGKALVQLIENPTTGYHWEIEMEPEGVLQLIVDDYEQEEAPEGMVGVGGVHNWVLRALEEGEARLVFRSIGPGESDQSPDATVVLAYIVDSDLNVTLWGVGGDYEKYKTNSYANP